MIRWRSPILPPQRFCAETQIGTIYHQPCLSPTLVFNFCRNLKGHWENTKVYRKYQEYISASSLHLLTSFFLFPLVLLFDISMSQGCLWKFLCKLKTTSPANIRKNVQNKEQDVFLKTFILHTSFGLSSINNLPTFSPLIILSSLWFTEPLKAIHREEWF